MPQINTYEVTVSAVRKGDVVEGQVAAQFKIGTKWAEIRTEAGTLIKRVELGTPITVQREEPTEEERNAAQDERAADEITRWVANNRDAASKLLTAAAEKGSMDHWALDRILVAQVEQDFALAIEHFMKVESVGEDIITATAVAIMQNRRRRVMANPLSRSTSVTSNLLEDIERYFYSDILEMTGPFNWSGKDAIARRIAELEAKKNH